MIICVVIFQLTERVVPCDVIDRFEDKLERTKQEIHNLKEVLARSSLVPLSQDSVSV